MKRTAILILRILTIAGLAGAQEQLSKRQLAAQLFERYEYAESLKLYLELAEKRNPDVQVIERVADCYRLMEDKSDAEQWYARAVDYAKANAIDNYYYAEALLRNKKIKKAREQYQAYFARLNQPEELKLKLATCDSAEQWMVHLTGFEVKAHTQLNTEYSEWGLTGYGKDQFIFTSDRRAEDEQRGKDVDGRTGNGYFKMFVATGDSVVLLPLNTKGTALFNGWYHAGPMALNAAGDTAYLTITTVVPARKLPAGRQQVGGQRLYTRRLQLIMATKVNNQWGNFKNFPYNNVKEYSVGHAALSKNGSLLYFASDMPGGEGKTDIWYCIKQADGSWGKPVNCGSAINTAGEEAFSTVNDDVLYFASKGLPGMGGYDVFKTTRINGVFSQPVNLKYPINSTSDDFYLFTPDNLNSGYISTNREGGAGGDDIYSFSAVLTKVAASTQLAKALPQDSNKTAAVDTANDEKENGHYILATIYYDLDKSVIRTDAGAELDKLVLLLNAHPDMRIQLSSYTDSRASADYNLALSKRRSAAAVAYLLKRGIARSRMVARYYGKLNLVNQCAAGVTCTEAEHQLNRRTEVFVPGGKLGK